MKLSDFVALEAFALFGPGYAGGQWTAVTELRAVNDWREAQLAFAAYEDDARAARFFAGHRRTGTPDFDVAPQTLEPVLHADSHRSGVEAIRAAISEGDVYQVNLTVRASISNVSGAALLAALCRRDVPPYTAWVRLPGGVEFVTASPELLFETEDRHVRSEPMKGTAPAGQGEWLLTSRKDRAELAMITDLVRNDLTPVCEPRSVRVANERRLIELPYAVQAVSDVVGTLLPAATPADVLAALHPGGSVTGAPKQAARAMIERLEPVPRGPYCGTLGLLGEGRSAFSLLIRTATRQEGGWVYGVGGGIVWDSDAELELAEVRVKLGALQ